jgi:transcription elongation factor GreA
VSDQAADGTVQVGSLVRFRDLTSDRVAEVTVVHPLEAVAGEGKVSSESPIGGALLGASAGQQVDTETPGGAKRLEILAVD